MGVISITIDESEQAILSKIQSEKGFSSRSRAARWAIRKAHSGTRSDLSRLPDIDGSGEHQTLAVMVRIPGANSASFLKRAQATGLKPAEFLREFAIRGRVESNIHLNELRQSINQISLLVADGEFSKRTLEMLIEDCQSVLKRAFE